MRGMYLYLVPGPPKQTSGRPLRGYHSSVSRGAKEAGNRTAPPRPRRCRVRHGVVSGHATGCLVRPGPSSSFLDLGRGGTGTPRTLSTSRRSHLDISLLHVKAGEMLFRFADHHRPHCVPPAWRPRIVGDRTRRLKLFWPCCPAVYWNLEERLVSGDLGTELGDPVIAPPKIRE